VIQSLEDLIVAGRVLRLFCSFTDPAKEKFVVVVATDPFCLGFLINEGLPRAYSKELFKSKSEALFEHVYESYFGDGGSVYAEAA
jgi:hypothetical protein